MMQFSEIKEFLDLKVSQYQVSAFRDADPILIPHRFTNRADIEVAAFFSATLAWGNRAAILKALNELMLLMDESPYHFVMEAGSLDLDRLNKFVYRTFNSVDAKCFVLGLRNILTHYSSLENAFCHHSNMDVRQALIIFRNRFDEAVSLGRSGKHLADVAKGSSGKRLNMFLRWMVRQGPVDFGIWTSFQPSDLFLPLDVHTGNVSRKLGLLGRKQNDWKAVEEVTLNLRMMDRLDPIKYDFALFGLGVYDKF